MSRRPRTASAAIAAGALLTGLLGGVGLTTPAHAAAAASPSAAVADPTASVSSATVGGIEIVDSFVSAVGWVKPGEVYPSRILLTNHNALTSVASVTVAAPTGTTITGASAPAGSVLSGVPTANLTWSGISIPAGGTKTLILESTAKTTGQLPTIVWRDLSTTATLTTGAGSTPVTSHGPKVIPPGGAYDTARYGDRPFPVIPVEYQDRAYAADHTGEQLEEVINDPAKAGSTYNLYQEMSLGQLFPDGTVPSAGLATSGFTGTDTEGQVYAPSDFAFTKLSDATLDQTLNTCTGVTFGDSADLPTGPAWGTPLYQDRVTNGVYNLPGTTGYYGQDGNGSAVLGSLTGVGALMDIDAGCGPTAKVVWDAAAIADPDIDYSDYDTDKDGVVDFFMAVFAGCGGNGASQLSNPALPCSTNTGDAVPYDNIWPHSSNLEYYYTDPDTGLAGYTTHDQLKDLEGRPLFYTSEARTDMTTTATDWKVFVRVGPYNLNPETAIDKASVISHEYGHSLGLPDFYSIDPDGRETYGDWNLMATDKSQNMDAFSRQELGWVVPDVLDSSRTVTGMTDSKQDVGTIHWQTPSGTPYTLSNGADGVVHNSQMYVAKLPGRSLLDPAKFDTGDTATKTHAWYSGSGDNFGCSGANDGGHNLDLAIPGLKDLPDGSKVTLDFKSMFDTEWDYDYGFVMTSTNGGETFHSQPSLRDTPTTTDASSNPNQNACQGQYGNGITGSSESYTDPVNVQLDRTLGNYPDSTFIADSFDISDLAGAPKPVLRFSYSTDPGVARPGWFIDDVKITATTPSGDTVLLSTDFEHDGGTTDPRIFNGGCQGNLGAHCTAGWQYVNAGAEAPFDHAYYLEMRDRSGFDLDGHGQIDRDPIGFEGGLYVAYTDEAHGYGNVGVTGAPAQSPLDANPEPGKITPDLNDAAWTAAAGRNSFTDSGAGHTDNYTDPTNSVVDPAYPSVANPWRFLFDCLSFQVTAMSGNSDGPANSDGDLTGDVDFTMHGGCGTFDYDYTPEVPPVNTPPVAVAHANPTSAIVGQIITFSGMDSHDAETSAGNLDFAWDFNGDHVKDASGVTVMHSFGAAGTYPVELTVSDGDGGVDTEVVAVTVTGAANTAPTAKMSVSNLSPLVSQKVRLSAAGSSDNETPASGLTYRWNFGDGGATVDATGATVVTKLSPAGPRTITMTVLDPQGKKSSVSKRVVVRREIVCNARVVTMTGSWREVRDGAAPGGNYCDNLGKKTGKDTLTLQFKGSQLDVFYGKSVRGGSADVFIDGHKVGTVNFHGFTQAVAVKYHQKFRNLGAGQHTVKLVVTGGPAYVDGFIIAG